jgi:hypothetical protein
VDTSEELTRLSGYYISAQMLNKDLAGIREKIDDLPAGTAVMIELKPGNGTLLYSSEIPEAVRSTNVNTEQVDELIQACKARDLYTIARVSAFRDYEFGVKNVPSGLMHVNRLGLWPDEGGCYWLDPTDTAVLNRIASIVDELKALGFNEVVLTDFRFPDSDSYIYNGDKDAALASAANSLAQTCADSEFTLSFAVTNAAFPLPEGRCRLYMENVDAKSVGANASQATMENPQVRLVFVAETNDTRFSQYSVLRPITASQVLEAQKANTKNN